MAYTTIQIDLDDIDEADMIKHLEGEGYIVESDEKRTSKIPLTISNSDFDRFRSPVNINDQMKVEILAKAFCGYSLEELEKRLS